ncbi:MAG: YfhO family protein [Gemmatimonadota bacterium]|nr:YfhO family protein [Gemmatimonadota bacterium]
MAWAALFFALATLALAYPALSGQFLVNPHSDQYIAGFGFRDFAVQSLRSGLGIPHWNPYLYGGLPYVAAMHGDIFYPTQLLRLAIGTDRGMTWGFIIHTFLAGLFTYGFLRAWGLGFASALVGGMSYLLCGPIASYPSPGHDGKLFVSALLPLSLWMLVRGMRDGRNWAWGAFAFVIGLATLAPHPQLMQYHLLTAGAFALFLAFTSDTTGAKLDRRTAVRRLSLALAAVLLGMAMGAIQFAPLREYVAWSPRAGGHDYAYATSYSFPIVELFNLYLPQFTGMIDTVYYGPNGIHLHSEYIGGAVLLLATLAFGATTRLAFRRFWLGTLIISLLWMLGGSTPFFRIVYELVPGTKFFRAPSTIIYVFAFALSVLAAMGTEKVLARMANQRVVLAWLGFAALIALLASGGLIANASSPLATSFAENIVASRGMDPAAVPQITEQVMSGNRGPILLGAWRAFLFTGLAAFAVLGYLRSRLTGRVLTIVLPLIVAVDLWSIGRKYWLFTPPARVQFASDPVIQFLQKERQPGRVLVRAGTSEGISDADPYFGRDLKGKGTGFMVHGIRSVTGYHGNELGRYDQIALDNQGQVSEAVMSPAFWQHENVRYLYTNLAVTDPRLKLLAGPVKNSAGSTAYLYGLPGTNPYAWVAAGMTKAPDADVLPAVLDPRFDPLRLAVFSDTSAVRVTPVSSLPAPSDITASTSSFGPGRATIALSQPATAGAALVVSENYFPGWTALVDGKPQPTFRADFNLIGVPLPAGARTVELSFHDAAVDTGKGITIVAALLAALLLGGGMVIDRRRVA